MIKQLPNGKYRVFSEKGRPFGTYDSKEKANKRLQQMEMFKSINKNSNHNILQKLAEETIDTYSSIMRDLNKNDKNKRKSFMQEFKLAFDSAINEGVENPEQVALMQAKQKTNYNLPGEKK